MAIHLVFNLLPSRYVLRDIRLLALVSIVSGCGRLGFESLPLGAGEDVGTAASALPGEEETAGADSDPVASTLDSSSHLPLAETYTAAGATSDGAATDADAGDASAPTNALEPDAEGTEVEPADAAATTDIPSPADDVDAAVPPPVDPGDAGVSQPADDAGEPPTSDGGGAPPPADWSPRLCTEWGDFGAPEPITGLGMSSTFGPSLSVDGSTLFFSWAATDIYMATRTDGGPAFSVAAAVTSINTSSAEVTPFISADGLSLYFASDRDGAAGSRDIFVATRPAVDADFGSAMQIEGINTTSIENLPRLNASETILFFTAIRDDGEGGEDIWMAERASATDPFSAPVNVRELNTAGDDAAAHPTTDGLEVFFISYRPGTIGSRDIWHARRDTPDDPFSTPELVSAVVGGGWDTDPAISSDGTELVFSSDRSGSQLLWRSQRTCSTP